MPQTKLHTRRGNTRVANGILAGNALAALNVANALHPFDRRGTFSEVAFFAGWPTSELPLQTLATLLGADAVAAARGDLRGWRGALTAALAGVSTAGLLQAYRTAKAAPALFDQALVEAFGANYRDDVVKAQIPGDESVTARAPGALRMTRIRKRFAHEQDISYGPHGGRNELDIWRREDLPRDGRAPVLIQIPGGAWVLGNKQAQAYPLMSHMAEYGWLCVAINYRLAPRSTWPDHIVDVKRAISWVKENIADHGGDPDFVAITGGSAGGHLSSLAALTPEKKEWQPGFEGADTSVRACVPFYGEYDWTDRDGTGNQGLVPLLQRRIVKASIKDHREIYEDASPMNHVRADAPPFFVSHGTLDSLIPIEEGREFVRMLRAVSTSEVAFTELPGTQHAYDIFGSTRGNAAAIAVERFLGIVYGRYLAERGAPTTTTGAAS